MGIPETNVMLVIHHLIFVLISYGVVFYFIYNVNRRLNQPILPVYYNATAVTLFHIVCDVTINLLKYIMMVLLNLYFLKN